MAERTGLKALAGTLRRFDAADITAYRRWFNDPALRRRLSFPGDDWLVHVTVGRGTAWSFLDNDKKLAALIQADDDGNGGCSIALAVDPERQRQGWGRAAIRAFADKAPEQIKHIDAFVEADNDPAQAFFMQNGFIQQSAAPDAEGILNFRKNLD